MFIYVPLSIKGFNQRKIFSWYLYMDLNDFSSLNYSIILLSLFIFLFLMKIF